MATTEDREIVAARGVLGRYADVYGLAAQGPVPVEDIAESLCGLHVRDVPLDAQVIEPEVQVLLVAHAQNLPDATLYAIDQFVMRGGRLIPMVDPHSQSQANRPSPGQPPARYTDSTRHRPTQYWGL